MSIYRSLIVALATFGVATSVFAANTTATTTATAVPAPGANAQPVQPQQLIVAQNENNTATEVTTTTQEQTHKVASNKVAHAEKVNINSADVKILEKVKGIGAKRAQAIVNYRKTHAPFSSVAELSNVKGFSKKSVEKIKDQITV